MKLSEIEMKLKRGIYKKGENFYIDIFHHGIRKREMVGPDMKLAEVVLLKRKIEIAEGKFLDTGKLSKIRFDGFSDEYLAKHSKLKKSYYTDEKIVGLLKKYFGGRKLHEITPLDIDNFIADRMITVSPATINRSLAVLKSMFNRAIAWGKAKDNPFKAVKMLKENNIRLRYLEKEEITTLFNNCHDHLKPIVIIAINTGMRKGEILRLKWRDIDFKRNVINISDTKSGERQIIPMNEVASRTFIKVLKNPESPYVFCNKDGAPYGDIKTSFLTALEKSSIIDFHFHDLRHTFASQLVMAGVDLNTVRELLRHKTLEMTLRYAHLSPDHKKRAVDVLGGKIATLLPPELLGGDTKKLMVSEIVEREEVTT